jgi:hypothetical protein
VTRERLLGIDAARALALVGMIATHTLALSDDGKPTLTDLIASGRASALFAVLAGVGIALSAGGTRPPHGRAHLAAGAGLAVRALLIGLTGLLLVELHPPLIVILGFYGLLFAVAIPLLGLTAPVLAAGAILACAVTPVVSHLLRPEPSSVPVELGFSSLATPGTLLEHLLLSGFYPVLTWSTYLLAGMAVGRLDLRRPGVGWALLGVGTAVTLTASAVSMRLVAASGPALDPDRLGERFYGTAPTDTWWWLAADAAHSGTPFDLAVTTGSALAVLGAMLLLARYAPPVVRLPAAVGSVPLTLYVLHTVVLTAVPPSGVERTGLFLIHLCGVLAVGVVMRAAECRGPLEAVVAAASRGSRAAVLARLGAGSRQE